MGGRGLRKRPTDSLAFSVAGLSSGAPRSCRSPVRRTGTALLLQAGSFSLSPSILCSVPSSESHAVSSWFVTSPTFSTGPCRCLLRVWVPSQSNSTHDNSGSSRFRFLSFGSNSCQPEWWLRWQQVCVGRRASFSPFNCLSRVTQLRQ